MKCAWLVPVSDEAPRVKRPCDAAAPYVMNSASLCINHLIQYWDIRKVWVEET